MHDWQDTGIVLSARLFGETDVVLECLTAGHGRAAGLVKGGASRKRRADFEVGNHLSLHWRARLTDQLGSFAVENMHTPSAHVLDDRAALLALQYVCTLSRVLPEREPKANVYEALAVLTRSLGGEGAWPALVVRYELGVLASMGYGLDLSECAGGGDDDLAYVSPRTGRAVSRDQGRPYHDKLLPLPPFLLASQIAPTLDDIEAGFQLSGFFLGRRLYASVHQPIPDIRHSFLQAWQEKTTASS